jgi:hypothetical protein
MAAPARKAATTVRAAIRYEQRISMSELVPVEMTIGSVATDYLDGRFNVNMTVMEVLACRLLAEVSPAVIGR